MGQFASKVEKYTLDHSGRTYQTVKEIITGQTETTTTGNFSTENVMVKEYCGWPQEDSTEANSKTIRKVDAGRNSTRKIYIIKACSKTI